MKTIRLAGKRYPLSAGRVRPLANQQAGRRRLLGGTGPVFERLGGSVSEEPAPCPITCWLLFLNPVWVGQQSFALAFAKITALGIQGPALENNDAAGTMYFEPGGVLCGSLGRTGHDHVLDVLKDGECDRLGGAVYTGDLSPRAQASAQRIFALRPSNVFAGILRTLCSSSKLSLEALFSSRSNFLYPRGFRAYHSSNAATISAPRWRSSSDGSIFHCTNSSRSSVSSFSCRSAASGNEGAATSGNFSLDSSLGLIQNLGRNHRELDDDGSYRHRSFSRTSRRDHVRESAPQSACGLSEANDR